MKQTQPNLNLNQQHLPNKQRIGKQDPYCCVTLNNEKRRTRAIKRGGQHPEWDEEVRFTLFEDTEDVLARSAAENANTNTNSSGGAGTPPPPLPPKKRKKVKGGNAMVVACFADDPKEPEFIGEAVVDLTEVLTKGETDGVWLFPFHAFFSAHFC
jgi:neural Wiskott-Aldrich syndrome protein